MTRFTSPSCAFHSWPSGQKFRIRQLLHVGPQLWLALSDPNTSHCLADLFCIPALEPPCCGSAHHLHTAVTVVDITRYPRLLLCPLLISIPRSPSSSGFAAVAFDLGLIVERAFISYYFVLCCTPGGHKVTDSYWNLMCGWRRNHQQCSLRLRVTTGWWFYCIPMLTLHAPGKI